MNESTLQLATLDDILDVLARRYPTVLLAIVTPGMEDGTEIIHMTHRGGLTTCIGLASRTHAQLLAKAVDAPEVDENGM